MSSTSSSTPASLASYIKEQRSKQGATDDCSTDDAADAEKTALPFNKEGAWAAVGFAVVLILVGVPVWWRTTTVYRAPLPYAAIHQLGAYRRLHFVPVTVLAPERHRVDDRLAVELAKHFNKPGGDVKFHVGSQSLLKEHEMAVRDCESLSCLVARVRSSTPLHPATATLLLLSTSDAHRLMGHQHDIHVTNVNLVIVSEDVDTALLADTLRRMSSDSSSSSSSSSSAALATATPSIPLGSRSRTPVHKVVSEPSYSLTITLMLPQPQLTRAYWDTQAAVKAYLSPLLEQLQRIQLHIKVRCQKLYMTPLSGVEPKWHSALQHYALPHTQLPLAINAIEAKLGSYVSTDPALHFIVYVPSREETPLHIHAPDGRPLSSNSFVVPRWGGVMIHNPPASALRNISGRGDFITFPLDAHAVMRSIMTQLHELMPIVHLPPHPRVSIESPPAPRLTQWQLDALARARVTQYYDTTTTTLQSLCELVGEISNMVVSEEVGGWVWQSVAEWESCGDATQEGRLQEASLYCTQAHLHAHNAFFHPSMLALLYFPDNQKYAIYVPLFLPVSIPVILSFKILYSLLKSYVKRSKAKTD